MMREQIIHHTIDRLTDLDQDVDQDLIPESDQRAYIQKILDLINIKFK